MGLFIKTKFNQATKLHGESITVEFAGSRKTSPYNYKLNMFNNHIKTACALAVKVGVELTTGYTHTEAGYHFAIKIGAGNED